MFEKEAEEWVKENMDCCKTGNSVNQPIPYFDEEERCVAKSAFQDGAEFGYNKANEWHHVKVGDLPKENEDVLVVYADKSVGIKHLEWNKEWWGNGTCCSFNYVIAWKEIVLPDLKDCE